MEELKQKGSYESGTETKTDDLKDTIEAAVDSAIEISVSGNQCEAYITVTEPKNGGKEPTYEQILREIELNAVVYGIKENILHSILDEKKFNRRYCFASYTPAVSGNDGDITYRFTKENNLAPVEDERGFVNYKDLGVVRNISEGDVIADITHPTEGTNGTDVRGNVLKCIPGKKAKFTIGPNTKLTDDGTRIISLIDGNLNYKSGAFVVDSVVNINGDVDSSVGNIDFTGDVVIKGDVLEGFKVISKANIIINGSINGAVIEAGGDIVIRKGCINSQITSEGNVSVNFCEYSKIKCGGDLTSTNFVICDVYCGGNLMTKGSGGGLHGGKYTCLLSVDVQNIGTKNYTKTELSVGNNAILTNEKINLTANIADIERRINDINLAVNYLKGKQKELKRLPEEKEKLLGTSIRQKVIFGVEVSKLQKRISEIDELLMKRQFLSVGCTGVIYPNVKIIINDEAIKIEDEYHRSRVFLDSEGEIQIGSF